MISLSTRSVQDIVGQVKRLFDAREKGNEALKEQIADKENQLQYLEKQTREHALELAKQGASVNFNKNKLDHLVDEWQRFYHSTILPINDHSEELMLDFDTGEQEHTIHCYFFNFL